jgi:hypothetical protein
MARTPSPGVHSIEFLLTSSPMIPDVPVVPPSCSDSATASDALPVVPVRVVPVVPVQVAPTLDVTSPLALCFGLVQPGARQVFSR